MKRIEGKRGGIARLECAARGVTNFVQCGWRGDVREAP